jgi:hypothetical protein
MATTQTLNAKYPDWTQEDWDRFHWINSWNRRRRNLASLVPCIRCGAAAIFEEDHRRHAVSQYVHSRLPEVSPVLGNHHPFEPRSVLGWIRQPEMHFFGGTKSGASAHGAAMEFLQFSRDWVGPSCVTETPPNMIAPGGTQAAKREFQYGKNMATTNARRTAIPCQW